MVEALLEPITTPDTSAFPEVIRTTDFFALLLAAINEGVGVGRGVAVGVGVGMGVAVGVGGTCVAVGLAAMVAAIPAATIAAISCVGVGLTGATVGTGTDTGSEPQAVRKKTESVNKIIPERIFV